MALKLYKPTTPTRRHTVLIDYRKLTKKSPEKALTENVKYSAGRNTRGKQTVRGKGGRVKRKYRVIDFARDKHDVPATVEAIEYDPNRTAFIALLKYADGERRYILAPQGLKVGDEVTAGEKAEIKLGNSLPLKKIPAATYVHNVELLPGKGGTMGRSAGTEIQIQGGAKGYVQLKLPSGEIRLVREECYATIGTLSNADNKNKKLGKAGRKRKMGVRPTVRGVAQSGATHPHGDGQGKSGRHGTGGPAKDKWGNPVGKRTRRNKRTNKFIVRRRPNKNGRKSKKYKTII
ncbi:MAG: 50S ribosomal protein L2 [candidate division WS6 bacterium OLB20]|uniref:Large ribosomal subunit protein uL2 n=1 Tax=candidate division WS6 bacterium OLB20 TaxID=1617426 RepID=A0A136LX11_9BACT|nr:MAG: 50S ribosomal protein L2 [candidate division WS6 bacterium OLB20]